MHFEFVGLTTPGQRFSISKQTTKSNTEANVIDARVPTSNWVYYFKSKQYNNFTSKLTLK